MTQLFHVVYVVVAVVLLFGTAIFAHEFGHYWMARRRGLHVEAFAIGFGPKILSWKRAGTEYSWRWIPAGGYVKLPQLSATRVGDRHPQPGEVHPASPWSRILVALAGPAMNVLFAVGIAWVVYGTGLPEWVNPPIIGPVATDSAEARLDIREGDTIVSVDHQPVQSWRDAQLVALLARTNLLPVVLERGGTLRTCLLKTVTFNPYGVPLRLLNLDSLGHPAVKSLDPDGPAAQAGLQPNDEVVSWAGVPIFDHRQLISLILTNPGEARQMVIQRAGEKRSLTLTPTLTPSENGPRARIGAAFHPGTHMAAILRRPGPLPSEQLREVWRQTAGTLAALWHPRPSPLGVGDLSGPPGILAMLAAQINRDFRLALSFLVLLNFNLAVLNLLPLPVLDGGHIMVAVLEAVRRPLNARVWQYATAAFALLLISLMLYASLNDLKRFSRYRSWFQSEQRNLW